MLKHLFIIFLLTYSVLGNSQARFDIKKYNFNNSTYDGHLALYPDFENEFEYIKLHYPSLNKSSDKENTVIVLNIEDISVNGDYLHYNGNNILDYSILAGGTHTIKGVGTLYGRVSYKNSWIKNISQNYCVNAEDYLPYLVYDTINSGQVRNEKYMIEGGMSFTREQWSYGLSGYYEGTASSKFEQPHRAVYCYWFRPAFSISKADNRYNVALKMYPEISKQNISVASSVGTYYFMQSYGMGQWNKRESASGYNYSRNADIFGGGFDMLFTLTSNKDFKLLMNLAYNYRKMKTEETSYKNLYELNTHYFKSQLIFNWRLKKNLSMVWQAFTESKIRRGIENVYETKEVDKEQYLYDYILVGNNQLYSCNTYSGNIRGKLILNIDKKNVVDFWIGEGVNVYKEEYLMPFLSISNTTFTTYTGFGFKRNNKSSEIDLTIQGAYRMKAFNEYELPEPVNNVQTLQTYIPYLIRGEEYWTITSSLIYAYSLHCGGKLGTEISAALLKRTNAPYLHSLPQKNKRSQLILGLNIFYAF
ncbi:MAG: hypothetical protein H9802_13835 [Candidatus Phocaeicola faecipullorum]|nr:hypothetical protein [Candidatus Phocaeicola faecipullorum]